MAEITLRGFRRVQLLWGESIQQLAARELGNAARWTDVVAINQLVPPYVAAVQSPRVAGVAAYGDTLIIPSSLSDIAPGETRPDKVFGIDIALLNGRLGASAGDFSVVAGYANLRQALGVRVRTEVGELLFHRDYGCLARRLVGKHNDLGNVLLARAFVIKALRQDDRVRRVAHVQSGPVGDAIRIEATAVAVSGHPVDVTYTSG